MALLLLGGDKTGDDRWYEKNGPPMRISNRCRCTSSVRPGASHSSNWRPLLNMTQAAVSQLEQRTDLYLSTLENFVEAMGGRLEMYAVLPDGKVRLGLERQMS